ncbi:MAG TPA: WbqC family protein, partial [Sphingobacteriaceae bacterium]
RLHWMSLQTCYRSSAYFEYYEDDFSMFYEKKWKYLFDYNLDLLQLVLKLLKLQANPRFTGSYEKEYPGLTDFRENIHPRRETGYVAKEYFQVFNDRSGFLPNLSIVDLLFNHGPQSVNYL